MSPLGGKGDAAHAQEDSLGVKKEGAPAHSSVQFSRSVASDSLGPHGLQHTRLPCPSSTPGAYSMPKPLLPIPQRPLESILGKKLHTHVSEGARAGQV